jgi:hypothetical protein
MKARVGRNKRSALRRMGGSRTGIGKVRWITPTERSGVHELTFERAMPF